MSSFRTHVASLIFVMALAGPVPASSLRQAPDPRLLPAVAWTGSELLVWGGSVEDVPGARYDPAAATWTPMATRNAPTPRERPAATWTGGELLVWGGQDYTGYLDTGAAYDPSADGWRPISIVGAPSARREATMVWTGTEALVWGGAGLYTDAGAAYDPASDGWRPMTLVGAPSARVAHSAVWTGSAMLIWGGAGGATNGGAYDPSTDTWRAIDPTGGVPAFWGQSATWTGREMIVFGSNGGGAYDPAADSWRPLSSVGAPAPRRDHAAVWSGTEVVLWGGFDSQYDGDGARYDPAQDSWRTIIATPSAPIPRLGHAAAWTGSAMLVWGGRGSGGSLTSGGLFQPSTGGWTATATGPAMSPTPRGAAALAWTGSELLFWGGSAEDDGVRGDGARYDPAADRFAVMSASGAPAARAGAAAVWTGTELLVWGGYGGAGYLNSGGRYRLASDTWAATSVDASTPTPRAGATAVWTGTELVVWGGFWVNELMTGGRYDPASDSWRATTTTGAPAARSGHTAVWTGSEMIVWGGATAGTSYFQTGSRYDPASDTWVPTSVAGAPSPRSRHTVVWTGREMVVWGGRTGSIAGDGSRYDPATDSWAALSTVGSPLPRDFHDAIWTGSEMIVWGGGIVPGGRYDPVANSWRPMSVLRSPLSRSGHVAAWTGSKMIVWGGDGPYGAVLGSGAIYDPARDSWDGAGGRHAEVLAGKARDLASTGATVSAWRQDGVGATIVSDAFPGLAPSGVRTASGDMEGTVGDDLLAGPAPLPNLPPRVRGFDASGVPLPGLDFIAFGTTGYGVAIGVGAVDGRDEILVGPGPAATFGPHVRGFGYSSATVSPMAAVSFYAYGTLRYGVNVAAGDLDGDAFGEILSGAGAGVAFGPHVRGFDFDGGPLATMGNVSFFAYATPRYGVEVGAGRLNGDGLAEILTGPGPSGAFTGHLRAFELRGGNLTGLAGINAVVFPGSYGLNVAAGDLDDDGNAEIVCGPGPDPTMASRLLAFDHDGVGLSAIAPLDIDVYGTTYGLRVGCGDLLP